MRWLLTTFIFVQALTCTAQYQVEFARLGVNEGLSQNSVYAIHQDEQGFLWIGTGDGLNRYDGKGFKIYREKFDDTSAVYLPGRIILSEIFQDKQTRLWFKTNQGIVVFDKRKERFQKLTAFNHAIKSWEGEAQIIGAASSGHVWFRRLTDFVRLDPQTWQYEIINTGLPNTGIADAAISEGQLHFLLEDGLYTMLLPSKKIVLKLPLFGGKKIHVLPEKRMAIATLDNIFFIEATGTLQKKPALTFSDLRLPYKSPFDMICEYPRDIFYLRVHGKGLIRYNKATGERTFFEHESQNASSLSNNYIVSSFIDRSNNLWLGTEGGGLSRLDLKPQKFKSFPAYTVNTRQAANLMVKSIFKTGDNMLIGTFSQGLYVVNESGTNFQQFLFADLTKKTSPASINVFLRDHEGRIWMNFGHAVGYLDTVNFRFRKMGFLKPLPGQQPGNFSVYSLLEYAPGQFLAGSNYGIHRVRLSNDVIETFNVPGDSVLKGHFQALQKAPDGSYYAGKIRDGYCKISITESGVQIQEKGLEKTGIRHFYFEPRRPLIWMASENGLAVLNKQNKTVRVFDEADGLSNSYLYSILPENDTTFWLSTNKGLNKAIISFRADGSIGKVRFNAFTQVDGLQSNEFNTGAFYKSSNGEFFFGGVNGVNWFKPRQIVTNHFRPAVVMTNLLINEKPYADSLAINYINAIELPHHQNTLSLRFASLEFTNAGANVYSYKLEGFDKDWINSSTNNEARYSNLPPGSYIFKVRGSNSDGLWSDQALHLSVVIHPPFWQTPWFRITALMMLITAIALAIRFYISLRVRNRLKELEKLRAVNDERIRISKDMHDELGTGLTKIALLSEVSRQKLQLLKTELPLQEIATTSRQLTQKMGEIIWTLDPMNDTLDNLAAYLKEQLYDISEAAALEVVFDFPPKIPSLTISNRQRQQILLVTREAFNNIIKHAEASQVRFALLINEQAIVFELRDNGKGFNLSERKASMNGKKNGLNNMSWRMQQIGGSISITSSKDEGTFLSYTLPIEK